MTQDLTFPEVTAVYPDYSKKAFEVHFSDMDLKPINVQYQYFLVWLLKDNDALLDYMHNHHQDSDFNAMIRDLYEIGVPIDDKVSEYIDNLKNAIAPQLLKFMEFLKHFGENSEDSE